MRNEADRAEQTFWVHTRGVIITLPPDATTAINQAAVTNRPMPQEESRRLQTITECSILQQRYPTPAIGEEYMQRVDVSWRETLYEIAQQSANEIAKHAQAMGKADSAIILFGSVAKNLTKGQENPDPSNIDMAVIGKFTTAEREELLTRIRPIRNEIEQQIGNNLGVHVQDTQKVINNGYDQAITYIASSARPLYDPTGIWSQIEIDALTHSPRIHGPNLRGKRELFGRWVKDHSPREQVVFRRPTPVPAVA